MTSTISSKGQIPVPKAVRDTLGLRPGVRVEFEVTAEGALLRKGHRHPGREEAGAIASCPTSSSAPTRLVQRMYF